MNSKLYSAGSREAWLAFEQEMDVICLGFTKENLGSSMEGLVSGQVKYRKSWRLWDNDEILRAQMAVMMDIKTRM